MIDLTLLKEIKSQFHLSAHSIHGISHWKRVEFIGRRLSASTKADMTVVSFFAYLHDSQRQNEGADPSHGERASIYCEQLVRRGVLKLTKIQIEQLKYACKFHSAGNAMTNDMTIATCWDADRLDLVRFRIKPDPLFLHTTEGKRISVRLK